MRRDHNFIISKGVKDSTYIREIIESGRNLSFLTYKINIPKLLFDNFVSIEVIGKGRVVKDSGGEFIFNISDFLKGEKVELRYTVPTELSSSEIKTVLESMDKPQYEYLLKEPIAAFCGNNITEGGEECDGSAPEGYFCTAVCTLELSESQIDIASPEPPTEWIILVTVLLALVASAGYAFSRLPTPKVFRSLKETADIHKILDYVHNDKPPAFQQPVQNPQQVEITVKPEVEVSSSIDLSLGKMARLSLGGKDYRIKLLEHHEEDVLLFVLPSVNSIHIKTGKPELIDLDGDGTPDAEVLSQKTPDGRLKLEFKGRPSPAREC